jgi:dihydrofolate reductase
MSLDGYIADRAGRFDWSVPDAEVHAVINDLTRSVGTFLLGRRLYEVLLAWESLDVADQPPAIKDFAEIWRTTDKVVYSSTLATASSARTRIETVFNPDAVRRMKSAADRDISVGGPTLAVPRHQGRTS